MSSKIILEVCAFNTRSAVIAEEAGATRIELCENPVEGGTTPGYGMLRQTREKVGIQLYPIIRPRGGNFLYDAEELAIMKDDIGLCRQLGCDGISTGVHQSGGEIDTEMMKRIVEWAYPMGVTCHRVFDRTPDPFRALEAVIDCGCERILTSGQQTAAPDATGLLAQLVQAAAGRITIMPGAGIRAANIERMIRETGATEFHTSARKVVPDNVTWQNPAFSDAGHQFLTDQEELTAILAVMKTYQPA